MNGSNMSNDSVIMDAGVENLLKKLAVKKEHPNDASLGEIPEVMRSTTPIRDFQKKISSSVEPIQEIQPTGSETSSAPDDVFTPTVSNEKVNRPIAQVGSVDVMVENTLKKLEEKKNSATSDIDYDHDTSGDVIRSKTSIQEFRNRFSSSSGDGKEGWNSLETTPIGKQNKCAMANGKMGTCSESDREVIELDNTGKEVSTHSKVDINRSDRNVLADKPKL